MSQINRLKAAEIANGSLINADDLNAELNQLLNESNAQDTRLSTVETTVKTDRIHTPGSGSDPGSLNAGDVWFNTAAKGFYGYANGNKLLMGGTPARLFNHIAPAYVSASEVKLPAGFACVADDGLFPLRIESEQVVDVTDSGSNGLDTGSEASNTWYYLWVIGDSAGTNPARGLFSTSYTSPTMPSGYDKKRFTRIAVRNDASSNFIPFHVVHWPDSVVVLYRAQTTYYRTTTQVGSCNVLAAGSAGSYTTVSLASFVPAHATRWVPHYYANGGYFLGDLRVTGTTTEVFDLSVATGGAGLYAPILPCSSSQQMDYRLNSATGTLYLDVFGYAV